MKKFRWLRSVAFILLLCVALTGVFHCYSQPKTFNSRFINSFADMPDNTVQGVAIGSSVIAHAWVSAIAYEKYGLTTAQFGSSVQPFGAVKGFIEYAQKNQDIKFVIIDVHSLRSQNIFTSVSPSKVQEAYLNVPDISVRYSMLNDLIDYAERVYDYYGYPEEDSEIEILRRDDTSLYLPILTFHNRWVDGLKKADYVAVKNDYLGANDRSSSVFVMKDVSNLVERLDFDGLIEINEFQKNELELLFSYLEEEGIEALFINTPSFRRAEYQQELSSILAYCEDRGYNTIDFSTREMLDKLGLDPATDFSDQGHVNLKGAQKVTEYICEYLLDNGYTCEDRRNADGHEYWDEGAKTFKEHYVKGWAEKGFDVSY